MTGTARESIPGSTGDQWGIGRGFILAIPTILLLTSCGAVSSSPGPLPSGFTSAPAPITSTPLSVPASCGDPHAHLYHAGRLQILAPCVTVRGVITSVRPEPDGDDHVRLRVDPDQRDPRGGRYVSPGNAAQGGDLVLEPVCVNPVTQADAVAACSGYHNSLVVPPVGSHVAATGAWVLDLGHGSWAELHPLFAIEVR